MNNISLCKLFIDVKEINDHSGVNFSFNFGQLELSKRFHCGLSAKKNVLCEIDMSSNSLPQQFTPYNVTMLQPKTRSKQNYVLFFDMILPNESVGSIRPGRK